MDVGYGSLGVSSRHTAGYLATEYTKMLATTIKIF
jgi:hypothetical protein